MEDVIFIISLISDKVKNGKSIIGYIYNNDKKIITKYVKNRFKLKLGEQIQNEYDYQNGFHWEYKTNYDKVYIHIDAINKIE